MEEEKRCCLRGMGVALVTPFTDNLDINYPALSLQIERIIEGGCDYIVVLGTTGETPTLTPREICDLRAFVKERVAARVPLVAGIGSNCTASLVHNLKDFDADGYSAVLSVVPFYNKPTQEGIFRHYMAAADNSPLPILMYNVPSRTGMNMKAETTLRLSMSHPNIIGVKEASGNLSQVEEIIRGRKDNFLVLSGDDALTVDMMKLGADGVISVVGNAYPKEFSALVKLCEAGEFEAAQEINAHLEPLYPLLFCDGNPAGIKSVLQAQGITTPLLRLPLVEVTSETQNLINEFVSNFKTY